MLEIILQGKAAPTMSAGPETEVESPGITPGPPLCRPSLKTDTGVWERGGLRPQVLSKDLAIAGSE